MNHTGTDTALIRQIEELTCNSWPALQTLCHDGWLLRFADGYTRRANAVYPLYPSSRDLAEKVEYCEQVYWSRKLRAAFKLTDSPECAGLEEMLTERGYADDIPSFVMFQPDLASVAPPDRGEITLENSPTGEWFGRYLAWGKIDPKFKATMAVMLHSIGFPKVFATLYQHDQPVALGMSVVERGYMSFNDIVVVSDRRGQGLGGQLMRHLIGWGKANGARQGYLQVLSTNEPAVRLYTALGFYTAYRYWYRAKERTQ